MANILDCLSVILVLRVRKTQWNDNGPEAVKNHFAVHGNVYPLTWMDGKPPPQPEGQQPNGGETLFDPHPNCAIDFGALCEEDHRVFAFYRQDKGDDIEFRVMLCPMEEIETWKADRPLQAMQEAAGALCDSVAFDLVGYDKPYRKPGDTREDMRALTFAGRNPNWLQTADGKPILKKDGKTAKKAKYKVTVTTIGEVVLADA